MLGVDLGAARVGVAVSDSRRTLAAPLSTLAVGGAGEAGVVDRLVALVDDQGAAAVVVGLPLSLDGRRGPAARAASVLADRLAAALATRGVPVELADERFTTVTAHQALAATGRRSRQRRAVVDRAAATVLLQAWLDARRAGAGAATGGSGGGKEADRP